jgi:uncharacterized membrane protein (Fun14 family)
MEEINQTTQITAETIERGATASTNEAMFPYLELGTSFVIGLAVGYFLKKSFKILLLLLGFVVIVIFALESQGVAVINDAHLEHNVAVGIEYFKSVALFLKERLGEFPVTKGLGAVAGFFVGLKMG